MIEQLSGILKRITRGFPIVEGQKCKSLQSFAFVWDEDDINSDNLGKDVRYKKQPYFYSKAWESSNFNPNKVSFEYPSLLIWEDGSKLSHPFGNQNYESTTFVFKFVDLMPKYKQGKVGKYCETRIYEQIVQDLKQIIYSTFKKMGEFNLYELFKDGSKIGSGWYLQSDIDNLIALDQIDYGTLIRSFGSIAPDMLNGSIIPGAHTDDSICIFYRIDIQNTEICEEPMELSPIDTISGVDASKGCCP